MKLLRLISPTKPQENTASGAIVTPMVEKPVASAAFDRLPEPKTILEKSNETWEIFTKKSGAGAIVFQDEIVWAANFNGITAWDLASGKLKHYTTFDGLATNDVSSLVLRGNEVWAGSWEGGISVFDGNTWKAIDSQGFSEILGASADGVVWASSPYEKRIGKFSNGNWQIFSKDTGFDIGDGNISERICASQR